MKKIGQRKVALVVKPKSKVKVKVARLHPKASLFSDSTALGLYGRSLVDPFDRACVGVKIPDPYNAPTTALTCKGRFAWSPGVGDTLVAFPHPCFSVATFGSTISSGGAFVTSLGQGATSNLNYSAGAAIQYGSTISAVNLNSIGSQFRIVSWGVRVRNVTAALSLAGDVIVSSAPSGQSLSPTLIPALGSLQTTCTPGASWTTLGISLGVGFTGFCTGAYLGYPYALQSANLAEAKVYGAGDAARGILIRVPPVSTRPYSFRPSLVYDTVAEGGAYSVGVSVSQGGAYSSSKTFNADTLNLEGQRNAFVTTSNTGQNFEVEVIYHLELTENAGGALGQSVSTVSPSAPTNLVNDLLDRVRKLPWTDVLASAVSVVRTYGPAALAAL